MDTIKIKVEKCKNWAGNEYLLYSCEKFGKIAELDYPNDRSKHHCVYSLKEGYVDRYVPFSSMTQALVGAETLVGGYLLDMGYYATYDYPRTIKMK